MTRKEFLLALGTASTAAGMRLDTARPKVLLVVAHPDDEYAFAAAVYRIAKELDGTVDQVVITSGEAGYRYSSLAERYYSASLTNESVGRARLPEIRRRETLAAGRVLGIRHHHFLNQRDARFTLDPAEAFGLWDTEGVTRWIANLLERERYDFVFTLLPTPDTHGHHQAATLIAVDAISRLPAEGRPVSLAADPAIKADPSRAYSGLAGRPETHPWPGAPVFRFDRLAHFGFHQSLTYQIVVNWMIAEHKSQGLFQMECNRFDEERFWLLARNPADALERTTALFDALRAPAGCVAVAASVP
ncbi:MAG TPA: PIG-L family deacetylase [Bryobacteraceae bacterium]|nr:PIG-L family deacetylase [Bryobacteraceae bacterium]